MTKPHKTLLLVALAGTLFSNGAWADSLTNRLEQLKPELTRQYSLPLRQWRFSQQNLPAAGQLPFDDSLWPIVFPGFSWSGEGSNAWFRAKVEVPATVAGRPVEAMPVQLDMGVSGECELYVDGQLKEAFRGDNCHYTLTEHAHAGEIFNLAVRNVTGPRNRKFNFARLSFNALPALDEYLDDLTFIALLARHVTASQQTTLDHALSSSEDYIQFTNITPDKLDSVRAQLVKARAALAPVTAITRKYDVYYIGHAHIDMNWQWTWPETIDVCHRTWNSAMNLMQEFPDLHFIQSQPGAYVPIEEMYPDEFARMQAAVARGQWDLVGGLWDESDTDIPSGEGLARSFLVGQTYFKSKFGKYAVTGWLPDSFGHSWQLPQIMQLVGIRNFYHMRCGNGMEFTWWQAPDGSRVLKANTRSYDTRPQLEQLVVPLENESRFGLPQSVVIFGVGDHGGGPTREQILRIQGFQRDPIFPRVHFIGADAFFDQLSQQPATASVPVVDTDLQYTFEGCYTTHADAKLALRSSEDNLYTAEVLSSLAAIMGQPYPVAAFDDAWKPVAFAQFHDIAAGSAIHSTYDWMREQLAPAFQFEQEQTEKSLDALTAEADTRGPGDKAIVVWNTLSFSREDVVKAALADAAQYHSVMDNQGRQFPAQAMDETNLVFIARGVPAFGHTVYFPATNSCASDGITLTDGSDTCEMQTPALALQISKTTGAITRLYSQSAKWNVFGDATDANSLQLLGDSGSAWIIKYTGTHQILTTEGAEVSILDAGPVFARVRVSHAFGKSSYTQVLTVYGALPRVDVPTTVDWHTEHELLKIRFQIAATNLQADAQIPYGSIVRPVTGQECPGQKWMDISQAETDPAPSSTNKLDAPARYGLSILNDCKYGFDVTSNVFRLTALRSSDRPDPHPDQGLQKFTYSLYPHAGGWRTAHTDEQALALNIPLLVKVTTPHPSDGQIPSLSVENIGGQGDLIVSALKRSEDGNDFILRFYEADGQDTRARITFDQPVRATKTDILERPLPDQSLTVEGNSVTLPVGHNQIITLRLSFNS